MDVLSDVLRSLRLSGSAYFCRDLPVPWGMDEVASTQGIFHAVVRGTAYYQLEAESTPTALSSGDILVLPAGAAHWLSDHPDSRRRHAPDVLPSLIEGGSPFGEGEAQGERVQSTTLMCGHFEYDQLMSHSLLNSLPDALVIRAESQTRGGWLAMAIAQLAAESQQPSHGTCLMVDRLTEIMLIEVLRSWAAEGASPFLQALQHPRISRALEAIHEQPGHNWTLESLALKAGYSRSAFSQHFSQLLNESPLGYLTQWRMEKAKELLRDSKSSILAVALEVGYASEAAFNKAFKRTLQQTPGQFRKNVIS